MPAIFLYIVKLSISLAILWLFYFAVLRRLTFYAWNRWYLLGYGLFSFLVPLVDIGPILSAPARQPVYISFIPAITTYTPSTAPSIQNPTLSRWDLALLLMAAVAILLLTRTLIRWYSLSRVRKQASLISNTGVRIYKVDRKIRPFSFGNAIYINPRLHTEKEWEEIILHEYVHIRQHHTFDILLAEAITILNWYNPFAWALRHSIRQNLEFIADQTVLDNGIDKKGYQYHLLKVLGNTQYRLANNFNFSSLKKRIIMMNKMRSARPHLLRFLFLLPLMAVTLLAFRNRYPHLLHHPHGSVFVNVAGIIISLPEKTPLEGVTVRDQGTGLQTATNSQGYYKLQIPVTAGPADIRLEFVKQGYHRGVAGRSYPVLKQTIGMIAVEAMLPVSGEIKGFFMNTSDMTGDGTPVDPGYRDALADLHRVLDRNRLLEKFLTAQKAHPEIGLLYIAEDKKKALAIHRDGSVERFGYPGSPSLSHLDKKYGPLPWYFTDNSHPAGQGYLDRWATIAAQAEKEFTPTGGNPKAIIFPGDSRVIAVDASGKARIFDMDNTVDPKERPEFEKLYGKLPPCVPEKGGVAPAVLFNAQTPASALRDTVPDKHAHLDSVLWIVDGVQKEHWTRDSLMPVNQIASIDILKSDEGYRLFGDKGRKGVVAVLTKAYDNGQTPPVSIRLSGLEGSGPVILLDGKQLPDGAKAQEFIRAEDIETIQVLKDKNAAAQYGPEAGSRGAILITSKKPQKQP